MWQRRNRDHDLDEELRDHVERQIEANIQGGMTPDEARRQALIQFGNIPLVKEDTRAVWTRVGFEQVLQDLRFGARILTRSPGLSATAVILIALVVGINTTIFSMVNGTVRRPAPGVTAEDLVRIALADRPGAPFLSFPDYLEYQKQTETLRALTAFTNRRVTLTTGRGSYAVFIAAVDANYFGTVGVSVARGRAFGLSEKSIGPSGLTAIISDQAWKNYFDGDPQIIGRGIEINGVPATIVGVAPPLFRGMGLTERSDVWLPLLAFWQGVMPDDARAVADRNIATVELVGSLAPGRRVSEAQAEFSTIEARLRLSDPSIERHPVSVVRYAGTAGGVAPAIMPAFLALFSIVTLLTVLIVSANVANLMLARSMARQRETALRQSLGASRTRIVRLLLAEGLSISLLAWVAACVMTMWAVRAIPQQLLPPTPLTQSGLNMAPDWRVVSYAMLLAAVGTVAFTLAPALRVWKQDPLPWMKAGEQSVAQGRSRLSSALVILQLAFSVVLLTGAGLASRSAAMMQVDVGFESRNLLLVRISTAGSVRSRDAHVSLTNQVRERLTQIPGVQSVSYFGFPARRPVRTLGSGPPANAAFYGVGPDYFKVLGLRLIAGRTLEPDDHARATAVAVVNQNLADALWPGQDAVGQAMQFGPDRQSVEIVGIVANAFVAGFNPERPEPKPNFAFVPEQRSISGALPGEVTLQVRYAGSLETVAGAVGPMLRDTDRRIAIVSQNTMDEQLERMTLSASMIARLLAIFSIVSLLIAAIGQYAVVAFNMRRRVREFGVRIALGASAGQVLGGVLREGLWLTVIGLVCGLALSVAVAVAARSVLFNVTPTDPQTYAGVFALLALVSLLACCLPARGASRVNPVQALRQE